MINIEENKALRAALNGLDPASHDHCVLAAQLIKREHGSLGAHFFIKFAKRAANFDHEWAEMLYRNVKVPEQRAQPKLTATPTTAAADQLHTLYRKNIAPATLAREIVDEFGVDPDDYESWMRVGVMLKAVCEGSKRGFITWLEFSKLAVRDVDLHALKVRWDALKVDSADPGSAQTPPYRNPAHAPTLNFGQDDSPDAQLAEELSDVEYKSANPAPTLSFGQADEKYLRLAAVLNLAYDQAANGKGKERHANDLPFHEQRMLQISHMLQSPKGMAFQVCKKVAEGIELPSRNAQIAELLGAINYIAGMVIFIEDTVPADEVTQ